MNQIRIYLEGSMNIESEIIYDSWVTSTALLTSLLYLLLNIRIMLEKYRRKGDLTQEELEQFSKLLNVLIGNIDFGTVRLLSLTNVKEEVMKMEEDTFKNNYGKPIFVEEEKELKDSCNLNLSKSIFCQLQEYQPFFKEIANLYFTPNIFKYGGRESKENVKYLTTLYADIDDVTAEEGLARLKNSQLPKPTYAFFSGHGVHLYWILDYKLPTTEAYIKSWLKVQKYITKELNSDPKVNEISRYMRIPLSFNNKEKPIKTKILIDNLEQTYDFREDFYNPFCKSKEIYDPNKYKSSSTRGKKKTSKNKGNYNNNYPDFLARDIQKLFKNRTEEDYQWKGIRNNTLLALKCLKYSEDYLKYINESVFDTPLTPTEFNHIINYKQKYEFIKREKVFEFLAVTESEAEELKVLVSEDEAESRQLIKELYRKYLKLLMECLKYCKINYINTASITKKNKEVAKKMKISTRDVTRFKKEEYSIQLKNSIIKTQLDEISISLEVIEGVLSKNISLENKKRIDEIGKKILRIKELMYKDDELTAKNKFKVTVLLKKYNEFQQLKED